MKSLLKICAAAMLCLLLSTIIFAQYPCLDGKMPIPTRVQCQPPLRDPGKAATVAPTVILALLQILRARG